MQTDHDILIETHRLVQENNKLLHSMRRHALFGGIAKMIFYIAIIVAPLWFYARYVAPIVADFQHNLSAMQASGTKAQADFSTLQDMLSQLQSIPGFSAPKPQAQ